MLRVIHILMLPPTGNIWRYLTGVAPPPSYLRTHGEIGCFCSGEPMAVVIIDSLERVHVVYMSALYENVRNTGGTYFWTLEISNHILGTLPI